jgi:hypothetical protein
METVSSLIELILMARVLVRIKADLSVPLDRC